MAHLHTARILWESNTDDFTRNQYSRAHHWSFDGGQTVLASSSPGVVRVPFSDPAGIDPEEALVAAIASCHMLTFLHQAAKAGFAVQRYEDNAEGLMAKNEQGRLAITRCTIKPLIRFAGREPSRAELDHLHHLAHEECFIANSVRTEIICEPQSV
ncbi:MAG: OsmC family protein [Parvibaculaceae bacterium]